MPRLALASIDPLICGGGQQMIKNKIKGEGSETEARPTCRFHFR